MMASAVHLMANEVHPSEASDVHDVSAEHLIDLYASDDTHS